MFALYCLGSLNCLLLLLFSFISDSLLESVFVSRCSPLRITSSPSSNGAFEMDCCVNRNCWSGIKIIETNRGDVCAGIDNSGMWCGGFLRCVSAKLGCLGDVNVRHTEPTCMCDCASENASTACISGLKGKGDANIKICGKQLLCRVRLGNTGCQSACTCTKVAEVAYADKGGSCVGRNVGAACGGMWNSVKASKD
jgi:hypothetical protein